MTFVVAHAAHAWLEAAVFAPPAVVVLAAIVRSYRLRQDDGVDGPTNKESA
jgi:hypothetical protein